MRPRRAPSRSRKAGASIATRRFGEAPTDTHVDRFATPIDRDPATVPLGERVALLLEAEKRVHVGAAHRRRTRLDRSVATRERVLQLRSVPRSSRRSIRPAAASRRWRSVTATRRTARFPATSGSIRPAAGRSSRKRSCARTRSASARKPSRCFTRRSVRAARSTSSWAARRSRCRSTSRAGMPPSSTASWAGKRTSPARVFSSLPSSAS